MKIKNEKEGGLRHLLRHFPSLVTPPSRHYERLPNGVWGVPDRWTKAPLTKPLLHLNTQHTWIRRTVSKCVAVAQAPIRIWIAVQGTSSEFLSCLILFILFILPVLPILTILPILPILPIFLFPRFPLSLPLCRPSFRPYVTGAKVCDHVTTRSNKVCIEQM